MASIATYKAATVVLLVLTIGSSGMAYYYYHQSMTSASNDAQFQTMQNWLDGNRTEVSHLNAWLKGNQTMISQLNAQILQLTTMLSGNVTENAQLETKIQQLQNEIQTLQSQVGTLQSELAQLNKPRIAITYIADLSCTNSLPGCTTYNYAIAALAYANLGNESVINANATITYWSGASGSGTALCTFTTVLGATVPAETIGVVSRLTCGSGTTQAQSTTYKVGWERPTTVLFTVIITQDGFNESKTHVGPWPVLNATLNMTVTIHFVNNDVQTHGVVITHYLPDGIVLSPGQTQSVTFKADQAGTFKFYCNFPCIIHVYMQNGELNVNA